jgi:hypothetical protein
MIIAFQGFKEEMELNNDHTMTMSSRRMSSRAGSRANTIDRNTNVGDAAGGCGTGDGEGGGGGPGGGAGSVESVDVVRSRQQR